MVRLTRCLPVVFALLFSTATYAQIDPLPNIKVGVSVGAYAAGEEFTRTVEDYTLRPALALYFEYPFSSHFGLTSDLVGGIISKDVEKIHEMDPSYPFDKLSYKTTVIGAIIGPYYRLPIVPNVFSASVHANLGFFSRITTGRKDGAYFTDPMKMVFTWGLGFSTKYAITPTMAAQISYNGFLTNSDELDGFSSGNDHDGFSHFSVGLVWNLYSDRIDDLPYETFAADAEDVIKKANETIALRSEGKSEWSSGLDESDVAENDAALMNATLELAQFSSLNQLERDDSRLILTLDKEGRATLPVEVSFELARDGQIVAQGVKSLTILQGKSALSSRQFVDFRGLNITPGYAGVLPDGEYNLRVIVEDIRNNKKSANEISFYKVNMEGLFGDNLGDMQSLIDDNKAQIVPSSDDEVMIRVLPKDGKPLYTKKQTVSKRTEDEPSGLEQQFEKTEFETAVSKTFDLALGIQNKFTQLPTQAKKPVILLAEIYFDEQGETYLDDGDKQLLYTIARRMRTHPQIRMELRGTADEYDDTTRSKELAETRAVRVMDSLSRMLVPGYRMEVSGVPVETEKQTNGQLVSKLENRKVSLVMTSY